MLSRAAAMSKKRKEKFTLFSDHTGSVLRRQPGVAMSRVEISFEST
jgi:hypothetical protein